MATKKKSKATRKVSKKKSSKKVSKKKTTKKATGKKVSKKKAARKKASRKKASSSRSTSALSDSEFFSSASATANTASSFDSGSPASSPEESESKSTLNRLAVIAVLAVLVVAFVVAQKLELFGPSSSQGSEEVQPEMKAPDEGTHPAPGESTDTKAPSADDASDAETHETVEPDVATEEGTTAAKTYTVQAGDSLYKIARKTLGSGSPANVQKLKDANGISGNALKVGQVLQIPR